MLNESFSKATVATHGLDDVAPRHRYVPRAQHPPGEVLPPSQERASWNARDGETVGGRSSRSDARDRSEGAPTHEGIRDPSSGRPRRLRPASVI